MGQAVSNNVVSLSDYSGTKRKAYAAARKHLGVVAPRGDTVATLAAYALCLLADPEKDATEKGAELAAVIERAAELA